MLHNSIAIGQKYFMRNGNKYTLNGRYRMLTRVGLSTNIGCIAICVYVIAERVVFIKTRLHRSSTESLELILPSAALLAVLMTTTGWFALGVSKSHPHVRDAKYVAWCGIPIANVGIVCILCIVMYSSLLT